MSEPDNFHKMIDAFDRHLGALRQEMHDITGEPIPTPEECSAHCDALIAADQKRREDERFAAVLEHVQGMRQTLFGEDPTRSVVMTDGMFTQFFVNPLLKQLADNLTSK